MIHIKFYNATSFFDLISNYLKNNPVDYVMGVEVGMDRNARKNRTGDVMKDIVESYLVKAGFQKGHYLFQRNA